MQLYTSETANNKEIMARVQASPSTFQRALADLVDQGLIGIDVPSIDLRQRIYYLKDSTREYLEEYYKIFSDNLMNFTDENNIYKSKEYHESLRKIENLLNIRLFSNEYEVILLLYNDDNQYAGDLFTLVQMSTSAFYSLLGRLEKMALVATHDDEIDRRRRRYQLGAAVRAFLDDQHNRS